MGIEAWLALVVCIVAGGVATSAWARREGVFLPAVAGLAAQGVLIVGLYAAVGLWAPDAGVRRAGPSVRRLLGRWACPAEVGEGKEAFPLMLGAVFSWWGKRPPSGWR